VSAAAGGDVGGASPAGDDGVSPAAGGGSIDVSTLASLGRPSASVLLEVVVFALSSCRPADVDKGISVIMKRSRQQLAHSGIFLVLQPLLRYRHICSTGRSENALAALTSEKPPFRWVLAIPTSQPDALYMPQVPRLGLSCKHIKSRAPGLIPSIELPWV
jgi:hypothetical protein